LGHSPQEPKLAANRNPIVVWAQRSRRKAGRESAEASEVSRILPLAFLAPSIVDSILAGTQPISLTVQRLSRIPDLPASRRQQTELLARA